MEHRNKSKMTNNINIKKLENRNMGKMKNEHSEN